MTLLFFIVAGVEPEGDPFEFEVVESRLIVVLVDFGDLREEVEVVVGGVEVESSSDSIRRAFPFAFESLLVLYSLGGGSKKSAYMIPTVSQSENVSYPVSR